MHELVLTASAAVRRIGRGIRTAEDADGVNGRPRILHRLSSSNGRTRHTTFETAATRRRTVGEEHHNLLSVLATRGLAIRKFQPIVSLRRTGRLNGIDGRLQVIRQRPDTRGQVLHHLAVVVGVPAIAIGIVTYLIVFLSRKLHERNPMLLGRVAYACVLLRDLVDKRVRRSLERINPLRVVATTHGIVHRARGVEHQHDIERLRDLRLQVRRGRKRRERREEIRLGAFLDRYRSVRPCQSDALGRHRLVGPDAADALGRVIQTPIPPRARRIGVGHRVLVACGIGRGSCARRARSRRSAFIGERERRHADGQREKR